MIRKHSSPRSASACSRFRPAQTDTSSDGGAASTQERSDDESTHYHYTYEQPVGSVAAVEAAAEANVARTPADAAALALRRFDVPYRPRVGEILARDSHLYRGQAPASRLRQTRRNYWPLVDNTVSALVNNAAAGANAVKNLLKVNFYNHYDNINAAVQHKKQKIKTILLRAAQDAKVQAWLDQHYPKKPPHPQQQQQQPQRPQAAKLVSHLPPAVVVYTKTKNLPSTTISEDYIHTYDNKYVPPKFLPPGKREKNPYAEMGVTSFKHFENTILKELEEKEERRVEATLHTLFDDQYVVEDTLVGTKPAGADESDWAPLGGGLPGPNAFSLPHPYPISEVHPQQPFPDVRPVCESLNDVGGGSPPLFFLGSPSNSGPQQAESNVKAVSVLPDSKRIRPKRPMFHFQRQNQVSTERPNYPEYFIKQQQHVKKQQQKLLGGRNASHSHKVLNRQKLGHQIHATASTTASPQFYFPINVSDDGFRPIIPSEMPTANINRPVWIKTTVAPTEATTRRARLPTTSTSTTAAPTTTTKSTQIQSAASNPRAAVVPGPKRPATVSVDSALIRKSPKKVRAHATNASNSTSTYKPVQKTNRGSIKFNDGLRNAQP